MQFCWGLWLHEDWWSMPALWGQKVVNKAENYSWPNQNREDISRNKFDSESTKGFKYRKQFKYFYYDYDNLVQQE